MVNLSKVLQELPVLILTVSFFPAFKMPTGMHYDFSAFGILHSFEFGTQALGKFDRKFKHLQ